MLMKFTKDMLAYMDIVVLVLEAVIALAIFYITAKIRELRAELKSEIQTKQDKEQCEEYRKEMDNACTEHKKHFAGQCERHWELHNGIHENLRENINKDLNEIKDTGHRIDKEVTRLTSTIETMNKLK